MSSTQSSCCSLQSSSVGMEKSMIGIKRSFQFSAIRHSCGFTYFVNQNHVSATGQSQDYQVVEQNPFKGCPVHRGAQLDQPVTQLLRSIDLSASLRCSGISPVTTRIREVISNAFKTYFLSKWFFSTNHPLDKYALLFCHTPAKSWVFMNMFYQSGRTKAEMQKVAIKPANLLPSSVPVGNCDCN